MVDESKRAAVFSWITGLFSASHFLGNVLARFLPENYIFEVCYSKLTFQVLYHKFTYDSTWAEHNDNLIDIQFMKKLSYNMVKKAIIYLNVRVYNDL